MIRISSEWNADRITVSSRGNLLDGGVITARTGWNVRIISCYSCSKKLLLGRKKPECRSDQTRGHGEHQGRQRHFSHLILQWCLIPIRSRSGRRLLLLANFGGAMGALLNARTNLPTRNQSAATAAFPFFHKLKATILALWSGYNNGHSEDECQTGGNQRRNALRSHDPSSLWHEGEFVFTFLLRSRIGQIQINLEDGIVIDFMRCGECFCFIGG